MQSIIQLQDALYTVSSAQRKCRASPSLAQHCYWLGTEAYSKAFDLTPCLASARTVA